MTITMTSKNQITIPKQIVNILDLSKGAMFDVKVVGNKIHLVPVEIVEKIFTDENYKKMDALVKKERKSAKKVTKQFIDNLK